MFNTIFPKIHKEGYKFLAISILITFVILFFSKFLGFISIIITVWVYYFFRDPERFPINDDTYLVSPADGLITDVSERSGPEELRLENTTYTRVSMFGKRCLVFFEVTSLNFLFCSIILMRLDFHRLPHFVLTLLKLFYF